MEYRNLKVTRDGPLGIIALARPQALNALNEEMAAEMVDALNSFEADKAVRCVVLTGGDKTFCAGADIKEMTGKSPVEMVKLDHLHALWEKVSAFQKPIVAALNGYALGGGLELAMACDMIVASEGTKLGQPEINIGLIPGGGGTQRLLRAVGKYKASEMILTGSTITARDAHALGLVNRVVPQGESLEEAKRLALDISGKGPSSLRLAKRAIARAEEEGLSEGIKSERALFYLAFGTNDAAEGTKAFLEKREPKFSDE